MDSNTAVKYFKLYREAHNMDEMDYVSNGEILVWLAKEMDKVIEAREASSPKAIAARHAKSLALLDEYIRTTPPEEVQALADSVSTSILRENWGVHIAHCCLKHGCKYGYNDCPVFVGVAKQDGECEQGDMDSCFEELKSNSIFLIEKAWINLDMDHNKCGYTPVGFVFTIEEAKAISGGGRLFTEKDYWEIPEQGMQEFIYTELNEIKS